MRRESAGDPQVRALSDNGGFAGVVWTFVKLVLHAALLAGLLTGVFFLREEMVGWLDIFPPDSWFANPGDWLSWGHIALPAAFFLTHLVNRCHGPGPALLQVLLAWGMIAGVLFWFAQATGYDAPGVMAELGEPRAVYAFVAAFFLAQIAAVFFFDRKRSRIWWHGPLYGSLAGGLAFVLLFYPAAFAGVADMPWANRMVVDLGIKLVMAFVLLIPYWSLRRFIRPRHGYGGA